MPPKVGHHFARGQMRVLAASPLMGVSFYRDGCARRLLQWNLAISLRARSGAFVPPSSAFAQCSQSRFTRRV